MATLSVYKRACIRALDDGGSFIVTSATASSVVLYQFTNATTGASTERHNADWLYVATGNGASRQYHVRTSGYVPSTGTVTIAPPFVVQPVATDQVELTKLFPCISNAPTSDQSPSMGADYRTLINRALARLYVPRALGLTITTADTYTTGVTYPWLDRMERLARDDQGRISIREPSPVAGRAPVSSAWRNWELVESGTGTVLQTRTPFASATGTLSVDVLSPADTFISGAESAVGLLSDTDTALAPVEDVVAVFLQEAYLVLMRRQTGRPDGGQWAKLYADQQAIVDRLHFLDRSARVPQSAQPVAA